MTLLSSTFLALPYQADQSEQWDSFLEQAPMATFLHTRRFLNYHGERFRDSSLMLYDQKQKLVGVFPAAVDPGEPRRMVSHPGITYGGILHTGKLYGHYMLEAMRAICNYYYHAGYITLRYKMIPYIYHRRPSEDDRYSLFRLGANCYRCDLSCTIDLADRSAPSQRRKRSLKKAESAGIVISEDIRHARAFWDILTENLVHKHGVIPVHTLDEIMRLHQLFPQNINFIVALRAEQVVAGAVLFKTPSVLHSQYIGSSIEGYNTAALDKVFDYCITAAAKAGMRYFDFGISNEEDGKFLNVGLYEYKMEFGGGGTTQDFYELNLGGD